MSYNNGRDLISDLERRISFLERSASEAVPVRPRRVAPTRRRAPVTPPPFDSRRTPRKLGDRTLLDMEKDAADLLSLAKRVGFLGSKIKYQGDFPVVVLEPRFYVFFDEQGYTIEYPEGGSTFTFKWADVMNMIKERALEMADWGDEEVGMAPVTLTPTYNDIHTLLTGAGGYLGERWMRVSDNAYQGGEYKMNVKCTPNGIKFALQGPYLKPGEPFGTLSGMVDGASRMEQLQNLAARLDFLARKIGSRRSRDRSQVLRLLEYPSNFGGNELGLQ